VVEWQNTKLLGKQKRAGIKKDLLGPQREARLSCEAWRIIKHHHMLRLDKALYRGILKNSGLKVYLSTKEQILSSNMFGKCFQILPHSCYIEFQKKMH
jgi:hypothetical protein